MWYDNTQNGEFELPIGAVVKFSDTGQIQLVDDEEQEHWVSASDAKKIKPMHPTSADGVEDMVRVWWGWVVLVVRVGGARGGVS